MKKLPFISSLLLLLSIVAISTASPNESVKDFRGVLLPKEVIQFKFFLPNGSKTVFTVKSTTEGSPDLDCFLYDRKKNIIMKDESDSPDCKITFASTDSDSYFFSIKNQDDKKYAGFHLNAE